MSSEKTPHPKSGLEAARELLDFSPKELSHLNSRERAEVKGWQQFIDDAISQGNKTLVIYKDGTHELIPKGVEKRYLAIGIPPEQEDYADPFRTSLQIVQCQREVMKEVIDYEVIALKGYEATHTEASTSHFMGMNDSGFENFFKAQAWMIGEQKRIEMEAIQRAEIGSGRMKAEDFKPVLLMTDAIDWDQFEDIFKRVAFLVKNNETLAGKVWNCIPPKIRKNIEELKGRGGNSFRKLKEKRVSKLSPHPRFINWLRELGCSDEDLKEVVFQGKKEMIVNEKEVAWEKMAYLFLQIAYTIERALSGWIKYGFESEEKFDDITAQIADLLGYGNLRDKMIRLKGMKTPYRGKRSGERGGFETFGFAPHNPIKTIQKMAQHFEKVMSQVAPAFIEELFIIERDACLSGNRRPVWKWTPKEAAGYLDLIRLNPHPEKDPLAEQALIDYFGPRAIPSLLAAPPSDFAYHLSFFRKTGRLSFPDPKKVDLNPKKNPFYTLKEARIAALFRVMEDSKVIGTLAADTEEQWNSHQMKQVRVMHTLNEIISTLSGMPTLKKAFEDAGILQVLSGHCSIDHLNPWAKERKDIEPMTPFAEQVARISYTRKKVKIAMRNKKYRTQVKRWGKDIYMGKRNITQQDHWLNQLHMTIISQIARPQIKLSHLLEEVQKNESGQRSYTQNDSPELFLIQCIQKVIEGWIATQLARQTAEAQAQPYLDLNHQLNSFFQSLKAVLTLTRKQAENLKDSPSYFQQAS